MTRAGGFVIFLSVAAAATTKSGGPAVASLSYRRTGGATAIRAAGGGVTAEMAREVFCGVYVYDTYTIKKLLQEERC